MFLSNTSEVSVFSVFPQQFYFVFALTLADRKTKKNFKLIGRRSCADYRVTEMFFA